MSSLLCGQMRRLSREQFERLAATATVISADEHGIRALLTPDDRVIKLFRHKRLVSSAIFCSQALRFARASHEFSRRGIAAALVEDVARVPAMERDLVVYRHIKGVSLRDALAHDNVDRHQLFNDVADLLARLHERGVYFRAAHLGNMLKREGAGEQDLALIDFSDTYFRRQPLSPPFRARNFRPLTRHAEDLAVLQRFGVDRFVRCYLGLSRLTGRDEARFVAAIERVHPVFAPRASVAT